MLQHQSLVSFLLFLTSTTLISSFTTDVDTFDEKFVLLQQSNEKNLKIAESGNFSLRAAAACDCGENAYGCKIDKGKKICDCKPSFAVGGYGLCVKACNETTGCANGGSCIQHVCVCLPGTSGPFCATIDDCERNRLCVVDKYTTCEYNVERQRAVCVCHVYEYRFDEATRKCRDCECTETFHPDHKAYSYCEYQRGEKTCTCRENYAYNPRYKICSPCNCGQNSKYCEFNLKGDKICTCEDGYFQTYHQGTTCEKCTCGKHGMCKKDSYSCTCDEGYVAYNKTCVECRCGKYGKCKLDVNGKQEKCDCLPGFAEKSGKCEMCYCGESSNCTFDGNQKICECPTGYENVNGFCADVNECKKDNPCDATQKCLNTLGSYDCVCSEGYVTELLYPHDDDDQWQICEDINECKDPQACPQPNTKCENTLGSYFCICKSGFTSRGGTETNTFCQKTRDWSIYTVVLVTSLIAVIGGLGILYCANRNLLGRQENSGHELS